MSSEAASYGPNWAPEQQQQSTIKNFLPQNWALNTKYICRSSKVRTQTLRQLLEDQNSRLLLPLFQRRYCWGSSNWSKLYSDVVALARDGRQHSLGRIILYEEPKSDAGSAAAIATESPRRCLTILDGQQRMTTCSLMIAAIRDVSVALLGNGDDSAPIVNAANSALLIDGTSQGTFAPLDTDTDAGDEFWSQYSDVAALLPTYSDRAAYLRAILRVWTPRQSASEAGSSSSHITLCKAAFMREMLRDKHHRNSIAGLSVRLYGCSKGAVEDGSDKNGIWRRHNLRRTLLSLLTATLSGLTVLNFELESAEDVQRMFAQLAAREAMLAPPAGDPRTTHCKGYRTGVAMSTADLVRNMIFSQFEDDARAAAAHRQLWLPVERLVEADIRRNRRDLREGEVKNSETVVLSGESQVEADHAANLMVGRVDKRLEALLDAFLVAIAGGELLRDPRDEDSYNASLLGRDGGREVYIRFMAALRQRAERETGGASARNPIPLCERAAEKMLAALRTFAETVPCSEWHTCDSAGSNPPPRQQKRRGKRPALQAFTEEAGEK